MDRATAEQLFHMLQRAIPFPGIPPRADQITDPAKQQELVNKVIEIAMQASMTRQSLAEIVRNVMGAQAPGRGKQENCVQFTVQGDQKVVSCEDWDEANLVELDQLNEEEMKELMLIEKSWLELNRQKEGLCKEADEESELAQLACPAPVESLPAPAMSPPAPAKPQEPSSYELVRRCVRRGAAHRHGQTVQQRALATLPPVASTSDSEHSPEY